MIRNYVIQISKLFLRCSFVFTFLRPINDNKGLPTASATIQSSSSTEKGNSKLNSFIRRSSAAFIGDFSRTKQGGLIRSVLFVLFLY